MNTNFHTESRMREICTYGSMRGRAYPTRGVPLYSTNRFCDTLLDMRKMRFIENCRCYHLISRLYPPAVRLLAKRGAMRGAHQAFFLDDNEKTRAVELLRRVEEFSIHFNRYYLSPLQERGIIARTDPDHPQSPQQRYCLT